MSIFKRLNIHSLLALAGVLGPLVLAVADLTAAISNDKYSLVRNSISSLALTPIGWLQTIGFLAIGLLVEIFVAGLLFNIRGVRGFRLSIGLLVFVGFGLLLIGAFRTDPTEAARTIDGTIHWVAAMTVFWLFPITTLLMASSLKSDSSWRNIFEYTFVASILGFVLVIGLIFFQHKISWFGLYERILVANMILWVEIMAIKLMRKSVSQGRKNHANNTASSR